MVGMAVELSLRIDVRRLSKLQKVLEAAREVGRAEPRVAAAQAVAQVAVAPAPRRSGRIRAA